MVDLGIFHKFNTTLFQFFTGLLAFYWQDQKRNIKGDVYISPLFPPTLPCRPFLTKHLGIWFFSMKKVEVDERGSKEPWLPFFMTSWPCVLETSSHL